MFDIDAGKLLIIGVIALVVLGPKELPRVLRQVGAIIGKMRRMAAEFQTQFMDAMKESEMDELKKDVQKIADQARVDINYDPVAATDREIREAIDGKRDAPPPRDPDDAIYSVDIPPPPATPDPAQTLAVETARGEAAEARAPADSAKKAGEA
ncbi:MAG TPA: Sec-independent protein translocase protein TatB [Beijerinckiaceae bacterium]|jgi:sec-independent protein translocase protein TatB